MLPQLARGARGRRRHAGARASGASRSGLAKKIVIGDYLAQAIVNRVFATPERFTALEVLLATYAYAAQIYVDFSGYTDVALGSAALFGYELPENFDAPYIAQNLQEFWHRWHMSLSTWLRDYLYKPLGGLARRLGEDVPEPDDHDGARRPLARRLVELRHLGRASRGRARGARACGSAAVAAKPRRRRGRCWRASWPRWPRFTSSASRGSSSAPRPSPTRCSR